jgi:RNA recognition motif-containing protein
VFVKFVPKRVSLDKLKEILSQAGPIASIKEKEPRAFDDGTKPEFTHYFVLYEDVSSAQKCIQLFDQTHPFGKGAKETRVDFWQPREDRMQ